MLRDTLQKDWGIGIPPYRKEDVMSKVDVYHFGLQILLEHFIKPEGYQILDINQSNESIPSVVVKIKSRLTFIFLEADVHPQYPELADSELRRAKYVEAGSRFGADCLYASITIGAKDDTRMKAGLALKGDQYQVYFEGFKEIQMMDGEPNSLRHHFYVLDQIRQAFKSQDDKSITKYVDQACVIVDVTKPSPKLGHLGMSETLSARFNDILAKGMTNDYIYCLFDGNQGQSVVSQNRFGFGRQEMIYPQTDGKPLLMIGYRGKTGDYAELFEIDFNATGLISKLRILPFEIMKVRFEEESTLIK